MEAPDGDMTVWLKLVESSPVIVTVLVVAVLALWRERGQLWQRIAELQREMTVLQKDMTAQIVAVHNDTLKALHENTAAVVGLTRAIDSKVPR